MPNLEFKNVKFRINLGMTNLEFGMPDLELRYANIRV